jgi:hypothetical protein
VKKNQKRKTSERATMMFKDQEKTMKLFAEQDKGLKE